LNLRLTEFQKRLCNVIQEDLPICWKPFDDLAKYLGTDEKTLLQKIIQLKELGIIRRISAFINYRALGMISTLVTAHISQENLQAVVEAVNILDKVSHNYLRHHHYNMWFTLQAKNTQEIDLAMSELSGRFDIDFHSMPIERVFKLDVRFDASGTSGEGGFLRDTRRLPSDEIIGLNKYQKRILVRLQDELDLVSEPFESMCGDGLESEDVLRIIDELIEAGLIRRIAAVVDHRKLGYTANVMFVGQIPQDRVAWVGEQLAAFTIVSHCYERKTFEGWPYNLFAMMHARSMGQIQHVINQFTEDEKIESFELLPTAKELKKQPVKYQF
jgi:DNA-binding Lrp family transcriptional regulator